MLLSEAISPVVCQPPTLKSRPAEVQDSQWTPQKDHLNDINRTQRTAKNRTNGKICFCQNDWSLLGHIHIQFNDPTDHHCSQCMITLTQSHATVNTQWKTQDTALIPPTAMTSPSPPPLPTARRFHTLSDSTRTELEVACCRDTGRQQCTRLSSAADAWSSARHQLKLYQQRHVVRRNLRVWTAVNVVILKPRPVRRTKYAERPHEIPSVKNIIDNASEVEPAPTQTVST